MNITLVVGCWVLTWVVMDLIVFFWLIITKRTMSRKSAWKTEFVNGVASGLITSIFILLF